MYVLETREHLIEECLDMFSGQILRRHNELIEVRVDICGEGVGTTSGEIQNNCSNASEQELTYIQKQGTNHESRPNHLWVAQVHRAIE